MRAFIDIVAEAMQDDPDPLAGVDPKLLADLKAVHALFPPHYDDKEHGGRAYVMPLDKQINWWLKNRNQGSVEASLRDMLDYKRADAQRHGFTKPYRAPPRFNKAQRVVLDDMLSRAPQSFIPWVQDLYEGEAPAVLRDPARRRDAFADWLQEAHSVEVRRDGLITFWMLGQEVKRMIGENAVALFHFTSSAVLPVIKRDGLMGDRPAINYRKAEGVYLTSEQSGPAVQGYARNAAQRHGRRGNAVMLTVRVTLDQIEPDDDDADISSGAHQFVTDYVAPAQIVGAERANP